MLLPSHRSGQISWGDDPSEIWPHEEKMPVVVHVQDLTEGYEHQTKMTYLMITHNMRAVAQYASRLVVLNKGKIVLDGTPSQVFACAGDLSEAGIVSPPIARLHGMLCNDMADWVALDTDVFLNLVWPEGALLT